MSDQRLEGRELIEKIYAEVDDPELRGQLLELVVECKKEPVKKESVISQLGISPNAVRYNVKLWLLVTTFVGFVFIAILLSSINPENSRGENTMLAYFAIFAVIIFALKIVSLLFVLGKRRSIKVARENGVRESEPWEIRVYRGSATIPRKALDSGK